MRATLFALLLFLTGSTAMAAPVKNLGMGDISALRELMMQNLPDFHRERLSAGPIQDDVLAAYLNQILNWPRVTYVRPKVAPQGEPPAATAPKGNPKFQRNPWDY
jgi:hypothetical protein